MTLNRRRLVWQLYPSFLFLIILVLVVVGWFFSGELRNFHYQQTADDLFARAQLVKDQVQGQLNSDDQPRLSELVNRIGEQSDTRITIILRDGKVFADSHENAQLMDNHGQRPEVLQAFSGQRGQSVRFSNTLGQSLMYVAVPVYDNGELIGSLRTALPVSDIDSTLTEILWQMFFGGLVIAVLLAPLCWLLSRRLSRPLELMTAGAQRFSRGELDRPLQVTGSEETGRLAEAMNQMAHELDERIGREVAQRSEIEAILSCMVEGIVAVDNGERVIRLNSAAADFFSVSPELEPGRSIQEVIRQAELQLFIRQALSEQKPLEKELTLHGSRQRCLHVQATPLTGHGSERIGVLIVLHDLTHLRQLESVRRDFVANVSHELKTPITAIRGAVETLIDDETDAETLRRFLQIIFKQSERLNILVEDLLDLSRIEQGGEEGAWNLEVAALSPVLENASQTCEGLAAKGGVQLNLSSEGNPSARIHPFLLEQAVENLLTNAIKYSQTGSTVNVSALEDPAHVIIRVQDFGCGIATEHQLRLFERFYRVDKARSRQLGGTGLGLAIVKHVAQVHGGEVVVDSTPGEGSTFSILLPKA